MYKVFLDRPAYLYVYISFVFILSLFSYVVLE